MTEVQGDFETQNQINHWRNRLDDIRDWYPQLSDTMTTISGYSMDLTGTHGTTTRMPGGDHLAMLGPWAADATEGDDLPHPAQLIHEWTATLSGQRRSTWAEAWRWQHDHVPEILAGPWADTWQTEIGACWHRLAALTGNAPVIEHEVVQRRLADHCEILPEDARLTLAQAEQCWPGIGNRVRVARARENARARREDRAPVHKAEPDKRGRYAVGDLREHFVSDTPSSPRPVV